MSQKESEECDVKRDLRNKVPPLILSSLDRYIEHRVAPGGFTRAVLENDLRDAFGRADLSNRFALYDIVAYIYNVLPSNSWGSREKVAKWLGEPKISE